MNEDGLRALRLSRQAALVADPGDLSILAVGCGGINSNALHMAVSMGYRRFTIFDPDFVAEENMYPGFFPTTIGPPMDRQARLAIGRSKAETLARWISDMGGTPDWLVERFNSETVESVSREWDIVIIGTDTLQSRREIWRTYGKQVCRFWWIDGRMGGPLGTVYTVDTANRDACTAYDKLLEGQESELPCGEKATAPLTKGFIAGMIGQTLADIANSKPPLAVQRYDMANRFYLNTKNW